MSDQLTPQQEIDAMNEEYAEWQKKYKVGEYLDNSPENWKKVQSMDPAYVWTNNSTCEEEMISNGVHDYTGSCCWQTFGWYISEIPCPTDENPFIATSIAVLCLSCNPEADEDKEDGEPDCEACGGTGYATYYAD